MSERTLRPHYLPLAGSEGSGGNENVGHAHLDEWRRFSNRVNGSGAPDPMVHPDDTWGSVDISGSGLPRGGTVPDEITLTPAGLR
jgi:hypothetical protein